MTVEDILRQKGSKGLSDALSSMQYECDFSLDKHSAPVNPNLGRRGFYLVSDNQFMTISTGGVIDSLHSSNLLILGSPGEIVNPQGPNSHFSLTASERLSESLYFDVYSLAGSKVLRIRNSSEFRGEVIFGYHLEENYTQFHPYEFRTRIDDPLQPTRFLVITDKN